MIKYILKNIKKGRERMQVVKEAIQHFRREYEDAKITGGDLVITLEDAIVILNYIRKSIPQDFLIMKLEQRNIIDRILLEEMIKELDEFLK